MSKIIKLLPKSLRIFLLDANSGTNFRLQLAFRYVLFASLVKKCGTNVYIGKNSTFKNYEGIIIGNNVSIHDMCYIDGYGKITIGNNVSIAHGSSILSSSHTWSNELLPIKYNKVTKGPVVINDDVWVGCGVRILNNVNIGERVIVAAGSVVNKDIEPNEIVAGVPNKVIKKI